MACISGEGPFTPSSVRVCAMSHEPYPGAVLLDNLAGPIPWPIIGARILRYNPSLSSEARIGGTGGLAMTSITDPDNGAIALDLDVRNPWTSVLHLVARLRGFVDYRLAKYAELWKEVYSRETFDGWPHIYGSCIHFADRTLYQTASITASQAGLHVLHQWPFYTDGTLMYHQGGYVERGWDRFYHGGTTQECCTNCSNLMTFNLTGLLTGMTTFAMRDWKNYCQCGGVLEQLGSDMLSRIGLLYNQPTPVGWPRHLLRDQGFWVLILAEERFPPQVATRLWAELLKDGLPGLLGEGDPATLLSAGMLMAHGGQVLGRNLYETIVARLRVDGDAILGGEMAVGDVIEQLEAAAQIVFDAYGVPGTGYPQVPYFDVSQSAFTEGQINGLNLTTFRASRSQTFLNWAGAVHVEPPSPVPSGTRPPPLVPPSPADPSVSPSTPGAGPVDVVPPSARGPADRASIVGPLVLAATALLGGVLVVRAVRSRRARAAEAVPAIPVLPEGPVPRPHKRGSGKRRVVR